MSAALSNPKFQDDRVRQAISLAIDSDLIIDVVYDGWAKAMPLHPWGFVFDEEPTVESGLLGNWMRHDPGEAKKLLAAAGASNLSFDSIYYICTGFESPERHYRIFSRARRAVRIACSEVDPLQG